MPGNSYDQLRAELARVPKVRRQLGIFIEAVNNYAVVQVGDEFINVFMVGHMPYPGSPVWVETQNGRTVCAGSSYNFSPYGTILSSPSSNEVKVQPDGGPELTIPYRAGLTLTAGNRVEINPLSRVVQGLLSTTPPPDPDKPTPTPKPKTFKNLLVQAYTSGSSNGGSYWQNNVNSDSSAGGAWFYNARLRSALKGVKTFTRVEVYLPRLYKRTSTNPTLRLHSVRYKPSSGLPSFGSSQGAGDGSGWTPVPNSWGEYMRDNYAGVGFAPVGGVYMSWRGTSSDQMSGAIRFSGTR